MAPIASVTPIALLAPRSTESPEMRRAFRPRALARTRQALIMCVTLFALTLATGDLRGESGDLVDQFPFPGIAPQGITIDGSDGSFWVTSFLDPEITHFAPDGTPLGTIPSPFGPTGRLTGIAWYPLNDTLLVINAVNSHLVEITKTGAAAGIDTFLPVLPVVNPGGPVLRGMAVHSEGGSGIGSIYVVETVGSQIYEIDLFGFVIRSFDHPQDADGFPGGGLSADTGGIELILDPQGVLLGIDIIGTDQGAPEVLRLAPDGTPTGFEIPLLSTGAGTGGVGGLVRKVILDPVSGDPIEALFGTAEALGVIFIVDGSLPAIAQINDLVCVDLLDTITMSWVPGPGYDSMIVERNGTTIATLPGTATGFVDAGLTAGVYDYSVHGVSASLTSDTVECTGVIGAGQVLDFVEMAGIQFGLDITEGGGLLYITTNEGVIQAYTKQLFFDGEIPIPFTGPDDDPAAIAFRPETNTLLVVNAFDNMMQEIDLGGVPIGPPVLLQIDVPDDDPTYLGAMAYDPDGNGGLGEIWAVESTRAIVYRLARDGTLLGSFLHPDEVIEPTPDPSFIDTFALGVSGVPEIGGGFGAIDLAGGTVFDRRTTRMIRVDPATGIPTGYETPLDGAAQISRDRYYGVINSTLFGERVTFALGIRSLQTRIYRLRREIPPVIPVSYLRCVQPDLVDRAEITFLNHGPYDSITIERNGTAIATLPGDVTSYVDLAAPPGRHQYAVIPTTLGVSGEPRRCDVRVGIGARLRHNFIDPAFSPYQLTRDASDGSFVVTTNSSSLGVSMFRFDVDLNFLGTIPAPENPPWLVAAIAVRPTATESEIWSITWQVPAPFGQPQVFHLWKQDTAGTVLSGPTNITIPGPVVGVSVTYPAAMVHDPDHDTFWFLERNTDQFLEMDLTGQIIDSFPHPMPPFQQFVFNLGLALDPVRDAFTATTAGPFETLITKTIEFSRDGTLTNAEISLSEIRMNPAYGIARSGPELYVSGSAGSIPMLVTLKAADPVDPPENLDCSETDANVVTLTWSAPLSYDDVVVRRGGVEIAIVPGGQSFFVDSAVGNGTRAYTVAGRTSAGTSGESACSVVVTGLTTPFLRGDASDDGVVNLGDPITILSFLFSNGPPFACDDAADSNDSGGIDLADAIYLLTFLFVSGPPPEAPFPTPGPDPTGDLIGC